MSPANPSKLRARYGRLAALCSVLLCGCSPVALQGQDVVGIYREMFTGINGSAVSDLTNSVNFPNGATSSNLLTGLFEAPVDVADGYGQRLRAVLVAPYTGSYTFFICSDDQSVLYLGQTESPATKQLIAVEPQWNGSRQFTTEERRTNATAFFPAMNPNLPANRSDYAFGAIELTAGQRYFIEALQKEGGGGDNLALAWSRPDGAGGFVYEGPVPASHFRATGVPFPLPPTISQQPASVTVVEREPASFSVVASSLAPLNYQWQLNGGNISGANGATYNIQAVLLSQNTQRYRCVVYNELGTNTTTEAILTVGQDTQAPTLLRVVNEVNEGFNKIIVTFSEPVETASATNLFNYVLWQDGTTALVALLSHPTFVDSSQRTVAIVCPTLSAGVTYRLEVSNVRDTAATPNTIFANSPFWFTASSFTPWSVGDPTQGGSVATVAGGYDLTVTSAGISGTADQFLFNYQLRTGDFDVSTRVESVGNSDAWARGGLMARGSLSTNSLFAGVFGTPSISGIVFSSRPTDGASASASGTFPVNYPYTWVRLRRVGNAFTGYASYDGATWHTVSSATIGSAPATMYVGMAASSRNPDVATSAAFREVANVVGGTISSVPPRLEPPGPSTRRSGLTISEIMYHPSEPLDGLDREFIEVFNSQPFPEDLSGYRLSGDIEYTFPNGTVIPAGGYLVVANVPADVQYAYGIAGVLGPYTNKLPNDRGSVRLRHRNGEVLIDIDYETDLPWPVAADGAGPSLVLRKPSYGEAQFEAWDASTFKGGSPGRMDGVLNDALANVVINEWFAHSDPPFEDFIELYNHGNQAINLGGAYLSDRRDTNKFRIPDGTTIPARGFVYYTESALGFALSTVGEEIYFVSPDNQRVLDAVRFAGQANGVSTGRHRDGAPEFSELQSRTPGLPNAAPLIREIVINELMFHPISDEDHEYVELHNRAAQPVDLSGWRFDAGIEFTFPPGTSIPAGGYLAVARDILGLRAKYPGLNAVNSIGDYAGSLSNSGERLALARRELTTVTNELNQPEQVEMYVTVDEVRYVDGGRWGKWTDGDGSSLELRDPRSDNRRPANWASSIETPKAPWVTIEHTGVLDLGQVGGERTIDEVQVMLLGAGECLIDEIEVFRQTDGINLVPGADFSAGVGGWFIQGNHVASGWNAVAGFTAPGSLHLRASGGGDNGANRLKIKLTESPSPGEIVTIRAKARWLAGSTNLLLRLYGNYLEASGGLATATTPGTPGQQNSVFTSNTGPAIWDVTHNPIMPAANQAVVVTTRIADPDGLGALNLRYRVDPSPTLNSLPLLDNGTGGDAIAGDGVFSATIPGQSANTLVAFHVEAADASNAVARFPEDAPTRESLVRFGESDPFGTFGTYRFWMTAANINTWQTRENLSNERLDMTFVAGPHRVIYNGGMRYRGSPWLRPGYSGPTGSLAAYVFKVPSDDPYIGFEEFNLDWLEQPGRDPTLQREKISFWIAQQMGVPFSHQRYVYIFLNGVRRGLVYTDSQEPSSPDYVTAWFDGQDEGDIYKIDDWFEFNDTPNREFNVDGTLQDFTTSGGAKKQARYRWNWEKKSNGGLNDDYTSLFDLVDAVNEPDPDAYTQAVSSLVDVEQWLRVFFVRHMVGDWDGYGYNRGKNMSAYRVPDGKFHLLLWDLDFSLGGGSDGPTASMFSSNDPTMSRFFSHPPFTRLYAQIMKEAVEGPLQAAAIEPVMDDIYRAFQESFVGVADPSPIKTWVQLRRDFIASTYAAAEASFAITSNGGNNFSVGQNLLQLTGTAPLDVRTITVNGVAFPVTWITVNQWRASIPLAAGANNLAIAGLDQNGLPVAGSTDTITVTFTGTADLAAGNLVINELMYNPVTPAASFVELFNRSSTTAFDLTGHRMNGVDFAFPSGTVITPGAHLVLAKNLTVFSTTYGYDIPVAGVFGGDLDHGGETISLIKTNANPLLNQVIDSVRYDSTLPWPLAANGFGSSLQLRDASRDNNRLGNWATAPAIPTTNDVEMVSFTNVWRYNQAGVDLGTTWKNPGYNDTAWPAGRALLYNETSPMPVPINTPLTIGPQTYYFRTKFTNEIPAATTMSLLLRTVIDDGVVIYLNGAELHRLRLAGNPVLYSDPASPSVVEAVIEGVFELPPDLLLPGENVIAAEVHQPGAPSSDIVFGLELTIREVLFGPHTPGAGNYTAMTLPEFPLVWINEVQPNNATGALDNFGDREPWLELYNAGPTTVDLSGLYLTDDYLNLTKWAFPAGAAINPGQWKVIWLDGEPAETAGQTYHTGFRLGTAGTGGLALTRIVGGRNIVLDYLDFDNVTADRAYGLFPDGAQYQGTGLYTATPGTANNATFPLINVVINEWMADNSRLANPLGGGFDDWFELHNAGASAVNLSGYFLTDNLSDPDKWTIPSGTTIAAGGYLLVWADSQDTLDTNPLHTSFALSANGESIGLFTPAGLLVDAVSFGAQVEDLSQGSFPNATGPIVFLSQATPGGVNLHNPPTFVPENVVRHPNGSTTIEWNAQVGRSYRVRYKDDLNLPTWQTLGTVLATSPLKSITDTTSIGVPKRFYLIELVP